MEVNDIPSLLHSIPISFSVIFQDQGLSLAEFIYAFCCPRLLFPTPSPNRLAELKYHFFQEAALKILAVAEPFCSMLICTYISGAYYNY